ncbi:glutamate--tRNA ligase [Corallococcus sp. M34]|uniref:glutamate--tRNA ligase n=1 Tax=Citreicoccus inhibens TaxID=2849499 RepID=UPI001C250BC6|nr:glutamate--tRNA ligase [Citreicoccus inhibens]MBU8898226.1 glutamate--tRNA ligase [Citreicoccus inhibens]
MAQAPRVRFAPSPTGYLHIGGARTALFNYLYARRFGGNFMLRMEDTDQERSTPESVQAILDGLKWLGLEWDEGPGKEGKYGPYFQTQRLDTYRTHSERLIAEGKAFRCYCTREDLEARRAAAEKEKRAYKYEGTCRELKAPPAGRRVEDAVIRFKMPREEGTVSFNDKVLGVITKPYSDLDDWVMLRADGIPLYNFGCVIDDHLMDITLVSRGQEHVNSTFPQLMLYQALGWAPPEFAHLPLILGPDREKLSKRKHPEADVMLHKRNGIMPEALLNFVIRLGWGHGNDEVISREQMLEWFDFADVGSTSGVWNPEKLLWLNQQWFKLLPPATVAERLVPFLEAKGISARGDARLEPLVLALRERARTLEEMATTATIYFRSGVTLDEKAAAKHLTGDSLKLLAQVREQLAALPAWSTDAVDAVVKAVSEQAAVGMGKVAQPLRVAVTGNTTSPGIGETLMLVGRDEALRRIDSALTRTA